MPPISAQNATNPTGSDVIREVFLSPRVVDREAFNEYATQLRRLIEQTAEHAGQLRNAADDANTAQQNLLASAARNQPKVEAALKTLAAIEARSLGVERLIKQAETQAARLAELEAHAGRVLEDRLGEVAATVERHVSDGLERIAAAAEQSTASLTAQREAAQTQIKLAAEDSAALISTAAAAAESRYAEIRSEAARVMQEAQAKAAELSALHSAALAETERRLLTLAEVADRKMAQLNATGDRISQQFNSLLARAEALLLDDPQTGAPSPASTLPALVKQAEHLSDDAGFATRQLAAVRQQADLARELLGKSILTAAEQLDMLAAEADKLKAGVGDLRHAAATAAESAAHRKAEITAALQGPLVEIESIGDELRQRLTDAMRQVQEAEARSRQLGGDTKTVVDMLSGLVDKLEPWRPLLIEQKPGELPAPLAKLIQEVQGKLAADLARVADGLGGIFGRTSDLAKSLSKP
ncbi:MAG: hypothetical protein ACK51N_02760 [bacterium]|jgi:hypothetical protein|nr:hypothetical protein [Phycisphaerales bacterium]MCE2652103.1 hypothetical protein [Planctomycetaceae bacterium]